MTGRDATIEFYTYAEAMRMLRISHQTVNRLIRAGRLRGSKVGSQWRFTREQILAALEPVEVRPEAAARGPSFAKASERRAAHEFVARLSPGAQRAVELGLVGKQSAG